MNIDDPTLYIIIRFVAMAMIVSGSVGVVASVVNRFIRDPNE